MEICELRPFKRLSDRQLLEEIDTILIEMRKSEKHYSEKFVYFNQLIREVKRRNICLSPFTLYNKVLLT